MAIRWKVVRVHENGVRTSCIVAWPYEPFCVVYPKKGRVATTKHGTLGLMTFETKQQARKFMSGFYIGSLHTGLYTILKVQSHGRGKKPKMIALPYYASILEEFYANTITADKLDEPPKGTICYQKLTMLE